MNTALPVEPTPREIGLDLVKIVATLLVILTHVNMGGTGSFSEIWIPSTILGAIARGCVPLFLLVTGALLVPRTDTFPKLFSRIQRAVAALVFGSVLTFLYFRLRGYPIPFRLEDVQRCAFPLWYLYMLIVAYLFLPLLQLLHSGTSRRRLGLLCLAIFLLYSVLPLCDNLLGTTVSSTYNLYFGQFPLAYIFFLLGGPFLLAVSYKPWTPLVALAVCIVSTAATAIGTIWLSRSRGSPDTTFIVYQSPTVVLQSASLFVLLNAPSLKTILRRFSQQIRAVTNLTLGVFLVHLIVLEATQYLGLSIFTFNIWLSAPATTFVVFIASLILAHILDSSRLLRYFVR